MVPSESRFDWTCLTLGDLCWARANSHDWHFRIAQLMAPSESRFDWTCLTLGDLCRAQAKSQDWHFGFAQLMAPSESRFNWTCLILGDLCWARANSQDWHFEIAQEDVEANLVFMTGGWHCNLPNGSSKIQFCIIACIPISSFQCQRCNSCWGIDKFSFFRPPTHGKLETGSCFLNNVDKFWSTDTLAK